MRDEAFPGEHELRVESSLNVSLVCFTFSLSSKNDIISLRILFVLVVGCCFGSLVCVFLCVLFIVWCVCLWVLFCVALVCFFDGGNDYLSSCWLPVQVIGELH